MLVASVLVRIARSPTLRLSNIDLLLLLLAQPAKACLALRIPHLLLFASSLHFFCRPRHLLRHPPHFLPHLPRLSLFRCLRVLRFFAGGMMKMNFVSICRTCNSSSLIRTCRLPNGTQCARRRNSTCWNLGSWCRLQYEILTPCLHLKVMSSSCLNSNGNNSDDNICQNGCLYR